MNIRKIIKVVRLGALGAPHAMNLMDPSIDGPEKVKREIWLLSGLNTRTKQWGLDGLIQGWGPGVATIVASEVYLQAPKIIKGLVKMFS